MQNAAPFALLRRTGQCEGCELTSRSVRGGCWSVRGVRLDFAVGARQLLAGATGDRWRALCDPPRVMIKAVLLDIDGTLVDSNDAHAHAWQAAFGDAGIVIDFQRIRSCIGMGGDSPRGLHWLDPFALKFDASILYGLRSPNAVHYG